MHNRAGPGSRVASEACLLEIGVIAPLVAIIVALGVYPQLILERTGEGGRRRR